MGILGVPKSGSGCGCCSGEGCSVTICVTDCSSNPISGATVTLTCTSTYTCTTGAEGCCSINIGSAGTCSLSITASGLKPYSASVSFTCGSSYVYKLLPVTTTYCCEFSATGCNAQAACDATVTINGEVYTLPAEVCLPGAGTYPWTIQAPNFNNATGTVTIASDCSACSGAPTTVTLTPLTNYYCLSGCVLPPPDALPATLYLTDTVYGPCTLAYDAGTQEWVGTTPNASFAGGCGCPAELFAITYVFAQTTCSFAVYYTGLGGFGVNEGCPWPDPPGVGGFESSGTSSTSSFTSCPWSFNFTLGPCSADPEIRGIYPDGSAITITP
jgi:hypothetical protein